MSETLKKIEALEAEIKKLKDEVNNPQFEVGKWYKHESEPKFLFYLESIKGGSYCGYGFGCSGQWFDSDNTCSWGIKGCVQATDKEVEDALIAEAKRRGFKEGAMFRCLEKGAIRPYNQYNKKMWGTGKELNLRYYSGDNHLFCEDGLWNIGLNVCSNPSIFHNGKWAEIVKDEPIKIGGYDVVREVNVFKIGCKKIHTPSLISLKELMVDNKFTKVSFDGVETDLETINKILNL